MPEFFKGVIKFEKEVFDSKKDLFAKLATKQEPEALFITCSDSRIDPNLLTQTEPGQLFICRNAGNIIPPYSGYTGAMTASIEFAVGVLNIPNIIICGHTECGAMKAALDPNKDFENLPHVHQWLCHCTAAVKTVEEKCKNLNDEQKMHVLLEENILLQVQHIKTHPLVAARIATGKLEIHAWLYNIKTGKVTVYDENAKAFISASEKYKEYAQKG